MIHAQSSARQRTHTHDQSNQVKLKKGGYTPKYENRARTDSEMSQNLEIHSSDHSHVGLPYLHSDSEARAGARGGAELWDHWIAGTGAATGGRKWNPEQARAGDA
jgi:hypothetical protein